MADRDAYSAGFDVADRRDDDDEGEGWKYVPMTVTAIFLLSTLFTMGGIRPYQFHGSGPVVTGFNVLNAHVLNMFMHRDLDHYFGDMLGLVLFGGTLTLLSNNRHVLGVVLAAHVGGSVFLWTTTGAYGMGSSLAVAGIIAATAIRLVAVLAGATETHTVERLLGGAFALLVVVAYGLSWSSQVYFVRVTDHHFGGWLFGALAETLWLASHRYRRT